MTVKDAARYLEVSPSIVYDLVAARRISHYRVGAGKRGAIRLDLADLQAYKASCRVEARTIAAPATPKPKNALPSLDEAAKAILAGKF